jgi:thymidine kinase
MRNNPQFLVFTGPMFSGKTTRLLSTVERFKFQQRHVFAFKPRIDDRYAANEIVSHMGWKLPATQIADGKELIRELLSMVDDGEIADNSIVAVDELFMIPGVAEELIWLYKTGITIVVSTLDMSYSGTPFDEVVKILPWATKIEKCAAVCTVCHRDANYTWKRTGEIVESQEIAVGGADMYEARCYLHHPAINLSSK